VKNNLPEDNKLEGGINGLKSEKPARESGSACIRKSEFLQLAIQV